MTQKKNTKTSAVKKKTVRPVKKVVQKQKAPVKIEASVEKEATQKPKVLVAKKTLFVEQKTPPKRKPPVIKKVVPVEVKTVQVVDKTPVKVVVSARDAGKKKKNLASLKKKAVDGLQKAIHMPALDKEVNLRLLVPNCVTMAALACGLSALHEAFGYNWKQAIYYLLFAGVFDGLDGRAARFFNASSKFGAELDSLSDFISFGVAPGIILYYWTNWNGSPISWVIVLFLAMCCAFRLARFNTMLGKELPSKAWTHFFTGLPAPGGAYMAVMPLIFCLAFPNATFIQNVFTSSTVVSIFVLASALLMASRVPTPSLKKIHISRSKTRGFVIFAIALLACLVARPFPSLSVMACAYLLAIILGWVYFHLLSKKT